MCFSAELMEVPVKLSIEEEKQRKAFTYHCLLTTNDGTLPDPYDLSDWLNEKEGMCRWPKLFEADIDTYFARYTDPGTSRKRTLSTYKVFEA